MNAATVLWMMHLAYGPVPAGSAQARDAYAEAIAEVAETSREAAVLLVLGYRENHYHRLCLRDPRTLRRVSAPGCTLTPYFGLVTWAASHGFPALGEGAWIAQQTVASLAASCTREGRPGLGSVLGRYHHGTSAPRSGCWPDTLSRIEVADVERALGVASAARRRASR